MTFPVHSVIHAGGLLLSAKHRYNAILCVACPCGMVRRVCYIDHMRFRLHSMYVCMYTHVHTTHVGLVRVLGTIQRATAGSATYVRTLPTYVHRM